MTEQQFNKAKEIKADIDKQQKDIETLKSLLWYGKTGNLIMRAIKGFVYYLHYGYGAMSYDCNLSVDEMKVLADYKAEKIEKLKQELSDL